MKTKINIDEFREDFLRICKNSQKILITSHQSPDGDSYSSVLGVYWYLKNIILHPQVDICYEGEITTKFSYFENFDKIKVSEDLLGIINNYDLIIFLDGSQIYRFTKKYDELQKSKITKICIDHHDTDNVTVTNNFDLSLIIPEATSTSELVYKVLFEGLKEIPKRACEVILLGILTDTGNFRFIVKGQEKVFDIVQRLIYEGELNIRNINSKYEGVSEGAFLIIQEFIKNAQLINLKTKPSFIITFIENEFLENNDFSIEAISDAKEIITQSLVAISGATWSVMVYPKTKTEIKISTRSLPDGINVRIFCENLGKQLGGKGGGHDLASGVNFENVKNYVYMKDFKNAVVQYVIENEESQVLFS
jgi:phosphoesterase RecJ-like protein